MLFYDFIEYLMPKMKAVGEFIAAFVWFGILIFGLNIFAAIM